ncbi:hypothetical protein [Rhodohalobacter mucosus]|uniref:Uncharacterized protein n=1 Tax=Rhodohalobacter mucosus TaxID=2079485 RepID=A0A316TQL8_9BACT|nr:hypothetical protein [Rhodohalobacter mucosus]PWN05981.1 hypothetical protein DDZ15_12430 [Rhodohalobacter mucosus]
MVSEKKIRKLINSSGDTLVTITMPTHRSGEESKQDPIRFKNLINEAAEKLKKKGVKENDVNRLLGEAKDLLDQPLFWSHTDHSLAAYISEDGFEYFRLPYTLESMVYLNDHFMITPLLPMMSMDGTFCVLAVSRQNARLLQCTRNDVEDITPQDVSTSVDDYLEVEPEKQLQFHSGAQRQRAMFFGHNANEEDKMVVVEQFMREFEKSVTPVMRERNDPLVLVGLKENVSLYKKVNNYRRLVDDMVVHNPDELQDQELRDRGWEIIQRHFLKDMYNSLEQFSEKVKEKVSNNLSEIAESTVMGRTETIFISHDEKKWGVYDEDNHTVHYSSTPGSEDVELLNWLAITGYKNGSKVYTLPKEEMPMRSMVAAEYRF